MDTKKRRVYLLCFVMIFSLFIALCSAVSAATLDGPTMDAITYYNQAVDAASNGSVDEALLLVNKSLEIQPDFPLALITKAGLFIDKEKYTDAEAIINKLELKTPDDPYVLTTKASIYVNTGRYEEALTILDKILEKNPELIEAWILKGTALGGLSRFEEEKSTSEKALALDPNNEKAKSNFDYAEKMLNNQ